MDRTNKDLSRSLNKPNNNRLTLCQDRMFSERGNDHSFRGNFKDARTIIDLLPELFPWIFKKRSGINKLEELVN